MLVFSGMICAEVGLGMQKAPHLSFFFSVETVLVSLCLLSHKLNIEEEDLHLGHK